MSTENTHAPTQQMLMHSVLQRVATGPEMSKDISFDEARDVMRCILDGNADPVQAGVFLIALRMKRETDEELKGLLQAIRDVTLRGEAPVDELVDIADPYDGFNRNLLVSPFLPAILSACGLPAVSHGVTSVGPKNGATHRGVLAAAGVDVTRTAAEVSERLSNRTIGWGYVDQAQFCPRLNALIGLRRQIVKRPALTTVEVLAGPVIAKHKTHLMTGYVHKPYPRVYAMLARHVGFDSALLVRGVEGGVIPSLKQAGKVWRYHPEVHDEFDVDMLPTDLGITQSSRGVPLPDDLPGYRRKNAQEGVGIDAQAMAAAAADKGMAALTGETGPTRDSLVYAGSLCLWHVNKADDLASGADKIREVLDNGSAKVHFEAGR